MRSVGSVAGMRWERLWADLEAQAAALDRDEFDAEVADRAAREHATVTLMDRVRGCVGRQIRCQVHGGRWRAGTVVGCGVDWLALDRPEETEAALVLLPASALSAVSGLGRTAVAPDALGHVGSRVDLRLVLRRLATAGLDVCLERSTDGQAIRGRLGVVGRDYVEIESTDMGHLGVPIAVVAAITAG